jgi:hypothetical protein
VRKPGAGDGELRIDFSARPQTDRLILEVQNGDNSAIALHGFRIFYPSVQLLFKTGESQELEFYYGNRKAGPPEYDLGLAASQLLRATRSTATLGVEEALEAAAVEPRRIGGNPGAIFWFVLVAVVGGLLFLIAKLLPGDAASNE